MQDNADAAFCPTTFTRYLLVCGRVFTLHHAEQNVRRRPPSKRHSVTFSPSCPYLSGTVKVKSAILHEECRRGAHLPSLGREHVGG